MRSSNPDEQSQGSFWLIGDGFAQAATNNVSRSTTRDSYLSLEEFIRLLRQTQSHMHQVFTGDNQDNLYAGLTRAALKYGVRASGDLVVAQRVLRPWFGGMASQGVTRVQRFAQMLREVDRPFRLYK